MHLMLGKIEHRAVGLGMIIEYLLQYRGIYAGPGCGCEQRKAALNRYVLFIPVYVQR